MRIGFDAKRAFNNASGLGNYSRYTINGLARYYPDNEYRLYTTGLSGKINYQPPKGASIILPQGLAARAFKSYWRSVSLGKHLRHDGIDLFHGLSNELPLHIRRSGVKSVVTIHDLIFIVLPELYQSIDRKFYLKKTRSAIEAADRIVAISSQTRKDLVEILGADEKKIRVVYQGCHPWFYKPLSEEARREARKRFGLPEHYVLYVGTIEKRKNLLEIVKAMHQGKINLPLVAVGRKTPYFDEVKAYITKYNIQHVYFHDFVSSNDLPAFYQLAELFVYPSSYEGFGIPVLEALNSEVPVITSRGGCLEETAGPGGILVDPGDTGELSHAIQHALEDQALRKELVVKGKQHALKFREDETIPALYAVYEELMR
jgi:glycosyltransferase involved in cell wall biosynthesis